MQEMQDLGLNLWVRKIPWRRKWQLTPVFWPGKSHGQRRLVGYSPWGHNESGSHWAHTTMDSESQHDTDPQAQPDMAFIFFPYFLKGYNWFTILFRQNIDDSYIFKFIFNWRIVDLQCCVGFCHIRTWIS